MTTPYALRPLYARFAELPNGYLATTIELRMIFLYNEPLNTPVSIGGHLLPQ